MKKIIGIILVLIGLIAACLGLVFTTNSSTAATSTAIIGGADGPTAVFAAGNVGLSSMIVPMMAGLVLVIIGVVIIIYNIRKQDN